jgi:hypothetical protein
MQKRVSLFLSVALMTVSSLTVAVAVPCACGPEIIQPRVTQQGSVVPVGLYNGAPFSWDRYVAPIVNIVTNGTTTTITVSNTGTVAGVTKFNFTKDQFTTAGMNNINPDLGELVKVLVAENFLPSGTTKTVYDNDVKVAVDKFQHAHNIHPAPQYAYGYFGPLTRGYLNTH